MFSKSTTVLAVTASLVCGAFNAAQADVYEVSIDVTENGTSELVGSGPGYQLGDMWHFDFQYDSDAHTIANLAIDSEAGSWNYGGVYDVDLFTFLLPGDDILLMDGGTRGLLGVAGFHDLGTNDIAWLGGGGGFSDGDDYSSGMGQFTNQTMNVTAVPAPGALALLGLAAGMTRRRRRG